ncbi:hypothetical protein [Kitasatospora sp. NPDC048407]|uniref:hypothetical protein n=1 Tax=Kitasatospora sp. NPDC048407 TaxID=3364051 RepID=UPI00371396A8
MAGRSPAAADEARARAHLAARVYGGLFPLAEVRHTLVEVFGRDPESHDGRLDSEGALFALTVDDPGSVLADSTVISTAAGRSAGPLPGPGAGKAC